MTNTNNDDKDRGIRRPHRARRQRGAELVEFALVLAPFFALITVLMNVSWAIFAKSTIQRAVRAAVDQGVQLKGADMVNSACLTDTVKGIVQQNAFGLLSGSTGLALIKVNYYQPPAPGSTADVTDVSTQTGANTPGNIMQVSVQNYSLTPLVGRIIDFNTAPDKSSINTSVYAAGVIQASDDVPCVGTAP